MSPNLGTVVHRAGQLGPVNGSNGGNRQGQWVDWRTPQASEAGAKVETLYTKDGKPAVPGQRAYRKTPSGKFVLQSQTINQQVEMVDREQSWATPRAGKTTDENPETWIKRQEKGDVATMPLTAQVKQGSLGKLNPRWVETLMGIPVGWTMPSCASPVTIEPMNSGFSEMASSQPQQPSLSQPS